LADEVPPRLQFGRGKEAAMMNGGRILLVLLGLCLATFASEPLDVLVVVDKKDARSERLAAFLKKGGFAPKVTTYADVTSRACDRAEVVLADSKLFRKNAKGSVGRARKFPKTKSPIVAVGFLGTELIEGHGVAMTSGYI
jgi:hypothetical protein